MDLGYPPGFASEQLDFSSKTGDHYTASEIPSHVHSPYLFAKPEKARKRLPPSETSTPYPEHKRRKLIHEFTGVPNQNKTLPLSTTSVMPGKTGGHETEQTGAEDAEPSYETLLKNALVAFLHRYNNLPQDISNVSTVPRVAETLEKLNPHLFSTGGPCTALLNFLSTRQDIFEVMHGPELGRLTFRIKFGVFSSSSQNCKDAHLKNAHVDLKNVPEHLKNVPEHLKNVPEHLKNVPEHLKDVPEHLKNVPEHLKNAPQHLKNAPQHLKNVPEHLKNAPQHLKNAPEHLKDAPEHLKDAPEHLKNAPEYLKDAPEHLNAPEHLKNAPGHLKNAPEHLENVPEHLKNVPEHLKNVPEGVNEVNEKSFEGTVCKQKLSSRSSNVVRPLCPEGEKLKQLVCRYLRQQPTKSCEMKMLFFNNEMQKIACGVRSAKGQHFSWRKFIVQCSDVLQLVKKPGITYSRSLLSLKKPRQQPNVTQENLKDRTSQASQKGKQVDGAFAFRMDDSTPPSCDNVHTESPVDEGKSIKTQNGTSETQTGRFCSEEQNLKQLICTYLQESPTKSCDVKMLFDNVEMQEVALKISRLKPIGKGFTWRKFLNKCNDAFKCTKGIVTLMKSEGSMASRDSEKELSQWKDNRVTGSEELEMGYESGLAYGHRKGPDESEANSETESGPPQDPGEEPETEPNIFQKARNGLLHLNTLDCPLNTIEEPEISPEIAAEEPRVKTKIELTRDDKDDPMKKSEEAAIIPQTGNGLMPDVEGTTITEQSRTRTHNEETPMKKEADVTITKETSGLTFDEGEALMKKSIRHTRDAENGLTPEEEYLESLVCDYLRGCPAGRCSVKVLERQRDISKVGNGLAVLKPKGRYFRWRDFLGRCKDVVIYTRGMRIAQLRKMILSDKHDTRTLQPERTLAKASNSTIIRLCSRLKKHIIVFLHKNPGHRMIDEFVTDKPLLAAVQQVKKDFEPYIVDFSWELFFHMHRSVFDIDPCGSIDARKWLICPKGAKTNPAVAVPLVSDCLSDNAICSSAPTALPLPKGNVSARKFHLLEHRLRAEIVNVLEDHGQPMVMGTLANKDSISLLIGYLKTEKRGFKWGKFLAKCADIVCLECEYVSLLPRASSTETQDHTGGKTPPVRISSNVNPVYVQGGTRRMESDAEKSLATPATRDLQQDTVKRPASLTIPSLFPKKTNVVAHAQTQSQTDIELDSKLVRATKTILSVPMNISRLPTFVPAHRQAQLEEAKRFPHSSILRSTSSSAGTGHHSEEKIQEQTQAGAIKQTITLTLLKYFDTVLTDPIIEYLKQNNNQEISLRELQGNEEIILARTKLQEILMPYDVRFSWAQFLARNEEYFELRNFVVSKPLSRVIVSLKDSNEGDEVGQEGRISYATATSERSSFTAVQPRPRAPFLAKLGTAASKASRQSWLKGGSTCEGEEKRAGDVQDHYQASKPVTRANLLGGTCKSVNPNRQLRKKSIASATKTAQEHHPYVATPHLQANKEGNLMENCTKGGHFSQVFESIRWQGTHGEGAQVERELLIRNVEFKRSDDVQADEEEAASLNDVDESENDGHVNQDESTTLEVPRLLTPAELELVRQITSFLRKSSKCSSLSNLKRAKKMKAAVSNLEADCARYGREFDWITFLAVIRQRIPLVVSNLETKNADKIQLRLTRKMVQAEGKIL